MNRIIVVILAAATVISYKLYFRDDTVELKQDLISNRSFSNDNKPVYMSGCQTFHGSVPPKVIYPTVKKNFMALTCALEVPPPYGVIALQRLAPVQDPKGGN